MYADSMTFDWLSHSYVNGNATTSMRHWPRYLTFSSLNQTSRRCLKSLDVMFITSGVFYSGFRSFAERNACMIILFIGDFSLHDERH